MEHYDNLIFALLLFIISYWRFYQKVKEGIAGIGDIFKMMLNSFLLSCTLILVSVYREIEFAQ